MPNSSQFFNNRFNINQVTISESSDIRFNIIKKRESIIYKTLSDIDAINLAYVINPELVSDDNIFASKKADELAANNLPKETQFIVFSGKTIDLSVNNFDATDIFITLDNGQQLPLFYKHVLKEFNPSNTHLILSDVVLLDSSLKKIVSGEIDLDYKNGIIYNNIKNTFDFISGDYEIVYVRYTIKDSFFDTINSYIEIINNQSVYRQASFDDLTLSGTLPDSLKVYTSEPNTASNGYEITFPVLRTYAIRESVDSRIHVIKPTNLGSSNFWFCSVTNGNFFASLRTTATTSNIFGYNLPEFNSQLFTPFAPYKFQDTERSQFVNNKTIKTLKNNIQIDVTNNFHVLVIGRNIDGTARFAISSDTSLTGTDFENIQITNNIRSVDSKNGFIDVSVHLLDTDVIETSYYYIEQNYEILDINFNPILNTDIIGQRIVFYLVPNTHNTRLKCLYYLLVDQHGIITHSNQIDNSSLTTDINTNSFMYDVPSSLGALNFIDKYSAQASPAFQFANPLNPHYFILSEVSTADIKHSSKAEIFDVRKEGGGIKDLPGLIDTIAPSVPEVQWTTNRIPVDGYQYPGNGSTYIEIPTTVQSDYGGNFTDIQLKSLAERHIGFGIYPILRGYSTNVICTVEPITDVSNNVSIKINWRSYGADKSYNVYYSLFPDHAFTRANNNTISDTSIGNTFTISTGLTTNTKYWVYVVVCDTMKDYPQTIIGVDPNHTYELLNKVQVQTYVFPT